MRGLDDVLAHAVQQQALAHEAAVGFALQALGAELVGHGLHFQVGELFLRLSSSVMSRMTAITRQTLPFSSNTGVLVFRQRLPLA